jgi:hypothetical protein
VYHNNYGMSFTGIGAGLTGVSNGDVAWGDYDNDGDLDILLTGYVANWDYMTKVYRNDGAPANHPPGAPTAVSVVLTRNTLNFSWAPANDHETPRQGLTCNLYVGTAQGIGNIMPPMANMSTGYRRVVAIGNTNHRNTWTGSESAPGHPGHLVRSERAGPGLDHRRGRRRAERTHFT